MRFSDNLVVHEILARPVLKKISFIMLVLALGCESKDTTETVSPTLSTAAQGAAVAVAVPTAKSDKVSVTTPDGKNLGFSTLLVWELDVGASKAPQLAFFTEAVTCDDRLDDSKTKFYAAFMGDLEPNDMNELADGDPYRAPNWGYTGLPEFVPGSEDDEGYPPPSWGTVTITKVDEKTVEGTVDFDSEGVVVRGPFVAQRCPDM